MVSSSSSASNKLTIFLDGKQHELVVCVRQSEPNLDGETLTTIAASTVGAWLRAWRAIHDETWNVGEVESPEAKAKVIRKLGAEPYVTVFNKTYDFSLTVHSHDNGQQAVTAAAAFYTMKDLLADKMPQLFQAPSTPAQAPKNAPKAANSAPDKNNVDEWLKSASDAPKTPVASDGASLPFRRFKRIADTVIQLQEFKQGGEGDKYQKSATVASLPYHKSNVQYEDDSLIYYAITGEITVKEGNYGTQAIIPTDKGRVYVDMKNKAGEESPDWHNFAQDLHDSYNRLIDNEDAKLFAPNCVLVMKTGKQKDNKQWKNYFHIYQPFVK